MASLWALIIITLIFQELATTAAVFAVAATAHLSLLPIHIIYIAATVLDMYIGYELGLMAKARFQGTKFVRFADRISERVRKMLGKYGDKASITVLAIFDYPYLNTFIASWLGLSRKLAFTLTFVGNFVWYIGLWAAILGLKSIETNTTIIFLIIAVVGVLSHIIFNRRTR